MQPSIFEGDIVIYKPIDLKTLLLKPGTIVVVKHPEHRNKLILKRIHEIKSRGIDVRGDNNFFSEDSRQFGLISRDLIIGVVENVIRNDA